MFAAEDGKGGNRRTEADWVGRGSLLTKNRSLSCGSDRGSSTITFNYNPLIILVLIIIVDIKLLSRLV